ncbi:MAG: MFS transporter [Pseudomonadota bacterium]
MSKSSLRIEWFKISIIGVMCMAQTFPYYLVNSTVPTIFRAEGLDLKDFWAFSLLTIPAWAKVLWAPLVDSYGWRKIGLRKSWIVACTMLGALSLFLLLPAPPSPSVLPFVVGVLFLHMLIMQTQDIAVDAYTLENLKPHERGAGAAFKVFAETIGEAAALGGLMFIYTQATFGGQSGWGAMVIVAAILLVLFTTPVILRLEPPLDSEIVRRRAAGERPNLLRFVKRLDTPAIAALLFVGGFINFMLPALIGPMLIDNGFALLEVGVILGVVTPVGAPLGAIASGALITRFGLPQILLALAAFAAIAFVWASFSAALEFSQNTMLTLLAERLSKTSLSFGENIGIVNAIITLIPVVAVVAALHMVFTVSRMGWASRVQAGTDFSLHGAIYNIGRTAAVALSPFLASFVGWSVFICVMGVLIVSLCLVYRTVLPAIERLADRRRVFEGEAPHTPLANSSSHSRNHMLDNGPDIGKIE